MVLFGGRMNRNQKWSHLSCCNSPSFQCSGEISTCQLSIGDQSKITQTSKRQKRRTLPGSGCAAIASTSEDYESPYHSPRNRMARLDDFRQKWGLSFRS